MALGGTKKKTSSIVYKWVVIYHTSEPNIGIMLDCWSMERYARIKLIAGTSLGWWRSTRRRCCQQTQDLSSRRRPNFLGNMIGRCLLIKHHPSIGHIYWKSFCWLLFISRFLTPDQKVYPLTVKGDIVESGGRVSVSLLDIGAAPTPSLQRWIWWEHHSTGAFGKH